ncbi:carotenoid oxygenase family protein [bacterium]|nr:carotenoid oxygenase family protein [bacterium]
MQTPAVATRLSSRAFEDLWEEVTDVSLPITGTLPEGLAGTLYRVVPTAFDWPKGSFQHWFDGHGQLHAIALDGRGGARYRSRFVQTEALARSQATDRPVGCFGTRPSGMLGGVLGNGYMGTANTNALRLGDRLYALQEGSRPVALDPVTLETLGSEDLGALTGGEGYSAHPHWDPERREAVAACLQFGRDPKVIVTSHGAAGSLGRRFELALPYMPSLVHDFGLSERHIVVPLFPHVFNPFKFLAGMASPAEAARWEPERGTCVLVTDRDGGNLRRYELPAMYSFHVLNCFDEQDTVVLDLVAFSSGAILDAVGGVRTRGFSAFEAGRLERLRLYRDGRVAAETLHPGTFEFPRIDPRRQGKAHRYGYFVSSRQDAPETQGEPFGAVARHDAKTGRLERWCAPAGHLVGEAVPVVKEGRAQEEAVWLLSMVYDPEAHRSRLVVLDGEDLAGGPVAEALLPNHLPLGFHGNFHRS